MRCIAAVLGTRTSERLLVVFLLSLVAAFSGPVSRNVLADTIVTAARDARQGGVVPVVATARFDRMMIESRVKAGR